MKKIYLSGLMTIFLFSGTYLPAEDYIVGADFLKIATNVRAVGMGEAYGAIARPDISNVSFNPATLFGLKRYNITLSRSEWFAGITHDFIGYAQPFFKEKGVIGVSGKWLTDSVPIYDVNGEKTDDYAKVYNIVVNLSSSWKITDTIQWGVNVKQISQSLAGNKADTFGLDCGLLYKILARNLNLGVVIQNIGLPMHFFEQTEWLPLKATLATAYTVAMNSHNFIIAVDAKVVDIMDISNYKYEDVIDNLDRWLKINLGGEYSFKERIFLRVGYKIGYDLEGISLGAGTRFGLEPFVYQIDYAYVPYEDLGDTHRVSLGIKF